MKNKNDVNVANIISKNILLILFKIAKIKIIVIGRKNAEIAHNIKRFERLLALL